MTEDSQSRRQGDGPSSEGAEPIAAQTPEAHPGGSVTPPAPHIPAQRIPGDPPPAVPAAVPAADSDPKPPDPTVPAAAPPAGSDPRSSDPAAQAAAPHTGSDPHLPAPAPARSERPPSERPPSERPPIEQPPNEVPPRADRGGRPQPAGGLPRPGYGDDPPYSISGVPISPPLSGAPYGTDPYAFDQPIYRPGAVDPDPPAYTPFRAAGPPAPGDLADDPFQDAGSADPAHGPYRRSGPSAADDPASVPHHNHGPPTSDPFRSTASPLPGDPAHGGVTAPGPGDSAYGGVAAPTPGDTAYGGAAAPRPVDRAVDPLATSDPYGFVAPPGRRIEPSPPPDRSRLYFSALAGLLAGLLIFGTAGWFVGRATAPAAQARPTPTGTTGLGIFEQNQVAINGPDFAGTALTTIAQGWLPYLATCTRNGSPGGPALSDGEKTRVRCTLDGMSAIFVEYDSIEERDRARAQTIRQGDAASLAPGVAPPDERKAPSARTEGNYVEYAYRLTERGTTRTVSGLWWDDARAPVAGYLLAYWKDGVGERWEPMRDLWSRYA